MTIVIYCPTSQNIGISDIDLITVVSSKVEEKVKEGLYIPYSSLVGKTWDKALTREHEFMFNAEGGLTAKGLDRSNEKQIPLSEWLAASSTVEGLIRKHHGDTRVDAHLLHHKHVANIACIHNWTIAIDYDIRQREKAAAEPRFNISCVDEQTIVLIASESLMAIIATSSILRQYLK